MSTTATFASATEITYGFSTENPHDQYDTADEVVTFAAGTVFTRRGEYLTVEDFEVLIETATIVEAFCDAEDEATMRAMIAAGILSADDVEFG